MFRARLALRSSLAAALALPRLLSAQDQFGANAAQQSRYFGSRKRSLDAGVLHSTEPATRTDRRDDPEQDSAEHFLHRPRRPSLGQVETASDPESAFLNAGHEDGEPSSFSGLSSTLGLFAAAREDEKPDRKTENNDGKDHEKRGIDELRERQHKHTAAGNDGEDEEEDEGEHERRQSNMHTMEPSPERHGGWVSGERRNGTLARQNSTRAVLTGLPKAWSERRQAILGFLHSHWPNADLTRGGRGPDGSWLNDAENGYGPAPLEPGFIHPVVADDKPQSRVIQLQPARRLTVGARSILFPSGKHRAEGHMQGWSPAEAYVAGKRRERLGEQVGGLVGGFGPGAVGDVHSWRHGSIPSFGFSSGGSRVGREHWSDAALLAMLQELLGSAAPGWANDKTVAEKKIRNAQSAKESDVAEGGGNRGGESVPEAQVGDEEGDEPSRAGAAEPGNSTVSAFAETHEEATRGGGEESAAIAGGEEKDAGPYRSAFKQEKAPNLFRLRRRNSETEDVDLLDDDDDEAERETPVSDGPFFASLSERGNSGVSGRDGNKSSSPAASRPPSAGPASARPAASAPYETDPDHPNQTGNSSNETHRASLQSETSKSNETINEEGTATSNYNTNQTTNRNTHLLPGEAAPVPHLRYEPVSSGCGLFPGYRLVVEGSGLRQAVVLYNKQGKALFIRPISAVESWHDVVQFQYCCAGRFLVLSVREDLTSKLLAEKLAPVLEQIRSQQGGSLTPDAAERLRKRSEAVAREELSGTENAGTSHRLYNSVTAELIPDRWMHFDLWSVHEFLRKTEAHEAARADPAVQSLRKADADPNARAMSETVSERKRRDAGRKRAQRKTGRELLELGGEPKQCTVCTKMQLRGSNKYWDIWANMHRKAVSGWADGFFDSLQGEAIAARVLGNMLSHLMLLREMSRHIAAPAPSTQQPESFMEASGTSRRNGREIGLSATPAPSGVMPPDVSRKLLALSRAGDGYGSSDEGGYRARSAFLQFVKDPDAIGRAKMFEDDSHELLDLLAADARSDAYLSTYTYSLMPQWVLRRLSSGDLSDALEHLSERFISEGFASELAAEFSVGKSNASSASPSAPPSSSKASDHSTSTSLHGLPRGPAPAVGVEDLMRGGRFAADAESRLDRLQRMHEEALLENYYEDPDRRMQWEYVRETPVSKEQEAGAKLHKVSKNDDGRKVGAVAAASRTNGVVKQKARLFHHVEHGWVLTGFEQEDSRWVEETTVVDGAELLLNKTFTYNLARVNESLKQEIVDNETASVRGEMMLENGGAKDKWKKKMKKWKKKMEAEKRHDRAGGRKNSSRDEDTLARMFQLYGGRGNFSRTGREDEETKATARERENETNTTFVKLEALRRLAKRKFQLKIGRTYKLYMDTSFLLLDRFAGEAVEELEAFLLSGSRVSKDIMLRQGAYQLGSPDIDVPRSRWRRVPSATATATKTSPSPSWKQERTGESKSGAAFDPRNAEDLLSAEPFAASRGNAPASAAASSWTQLLSGVGSEAQASVTIKRGEGDLSDVKHVHAAATAPAATPGAVQPHRSARLTPAHEKTTDALSPEDAISPNANDTTQQEQTQPSRAAAAPPDSLRFQSQSRDRPSPTHYGSDANDAAASSDTNENQAAGMLRDQVPAAARPPKAQRHDASKSQHDRGRLFFDATRRYRGHRSTINSDKSGSYRRSHTFKTYREVFPRYFLPRSVLSGSTWNDEAGTPFGLEDESRRTSQHSQPVLVEGMAPQYRELTPLGTNMVLQLGATLRRVKFVGEWIEEAVSLDRRPAKSWPKDSKDEDAPAPRGPNGELRIRSRWPANESETHTSGEVEEPLPFFLNQTQKSTAREIDKDHEETLRTGRAVAKNTSDLFPRNIAPEASEIRTPATPQQRRLLMADYPVSGQMTPIPKSASTTTTTTSSTRIVFAPPNFLSFHPLALETEKDRKWLADWGPIHVRDPMQDEDENVADSSSFATPGQGRDQGSNHSASSTSRAQDINAQNFQQRREAKRKSKTREKKTQRNWEMRQMERSDLSRMFSVLAFHCGASCLRSNHAQTTRSSLHESQAPHDEIENEDARSRYGRGVNESPSTSATCFNRVGGYRFPPDAVLQVRHAVIHAVGARECEQLCLLLGPSNCYAYEVKPIERLRNVPTWSCSLLESKPENDELKNFQVDSLVLEESEIRNKRGHLQRNEASLVAMRCASRTRNGYTVASEAASYSKRSFYVGDPLCNVMRTRELRNINFQDCRHMCTQAGDSCHGFAFKHAEFTRHYRDYEVRLKQEFVSHDVDSETSTWSYRNHTIRGVPTDLQAGGTFDPVKNWQKGMHEKNNNQNYFDLPDAATSGQSFCVLLTAGSPSGISPYNLETATTLQGAGTNFCLTLGPVMRNAIRKNAGGLWLKGRDPNCVSPRWSLRRSNVQSTDFTPSHYVKDDEFGMIENTLGIVQSEAFAGNNFAYGERDQALGSNGMAIGFVTTAAIPLDLSNETEATKAPNSTLLGKFIKDVEFAIDVRIEPVDAAPAGLRKSRTPALKPTRRGARRTSAEDRRKKDRDEEVEDDEESDGRIERYGGSGQIVVDGEEEQEDGNADARGRGGDEATEREHGSDEREEEVDSLRLPDALNPLLLNLTSARQWVNYTDATGQSFLLPLLEYEPNWVWTRKKTQKQGRNPAQETAHGSAGMGIAGTSDVTGLLLGSGSDAGMIAKEENWKRRDEAEAWAAQLCAHACTLRQCSYYMLRKLLPNEDHLGVRINRALAGGWGTFAENYISGNDTWRPPRQENSDENRTAPNKANEKADDDDDADDDRKNSGTDENPGSAEVAKVPTASDSEGKSYSLRPRGFPRSRAPGGDKGPPQGAQTSTTTSTTTVASTESGQQPADKTAVPSEVLRENFLYCSLWTDSKDKLKFDVDKELSRLPEADKLQKNGLQANWLDSTASVCVNPAVVSMDAFPYVLTQSPVLRPHKVGAESADAVGSVADLLASPVVAGAGEKQASAAEAAGDGGKNANADERNLQPDDARLSASEGGTSVEKTKTESGGESFLEQESRFRPRRAAGRSAEGDRISDSGGFTNLNTSTATAASYQRCWQLAAADQAATFANGLLAEVHANLQGGRRTFVNRRRKGWAQREGKQVVFPIRGPTDHQAGYVTVRVADGEARQLRNKDGQKIVPHDHGVFSGKEAAVSLSAPPTAFSWATPVGTKAVNPTGISDGHRTSFLQKLVSASVSISPSSLLQTVFGTSASGLPSVDAGTTRTATPTPGTRARTSQEGPPPRQNETPLGAVSNFLELLFPQRKQQQRNYSESDGDRDRDGKEAEPDKQVGEVPYAPRGWMNSDGELNPATGDDEIHGESVAYRPMIRYFDSLGGGGNAEVGAAMVGIFVEQRRLADFFFPRAAKTWGELRTKANGKHGGSYIHQPADEIRLQGMSRQPRGAHASDPSSPYLGNHFVAQSQLPAYDFAGTQAVRDLLGRLKCEKQFATSHMVGPAANFVEYTSEKREQVVTNETERNLRNISYRGLGLPTEMTRGEFEPRSALLYSLWEPVFFPLQKAGKTWQSVLVQGSRVEVDGGREWYGADVASRRPRHEVIKVDDERRHGGVENYGASDEMEVETNLSAGVSRKSRTRPGERERDKDGNGESEITDVLKKNATKFVHPRDPRPVSSGKTLVPPFVDSRPRNIRDVLSLRNFQNRAGTYHYEESLLWRARAPVEKTEKKRVSPLAWPEADVARRRGASRDSSSFLSAATAFTDPRTREGRTEIVGNREGPTVDMTREEQRLFLGFRMQRMHGQLVRVLDNDRVVVSVPFNSSAPFDQMPAMQVVVPIDWIALPTEKEVGSELSSIVWLFAVAIGLLGISGAMMKCCPRKPAKAESKSEAERDGGSTFSTSRGAAVLGASVVSRESQEEELAAAATRTGAASRRASRAGESSFEDPLLDTTSATVQQSTLSQSSPAHVLPAAVDEEPILVSELLTGVPGDEGLALAEPEDNEAALTEDNELSYH